MTHRAWALSEENVARDCTLSDCEVQGWFYVHGVGYRCGDHLLDDTIPSPRAAREGVELSDRQRELFDQYLGGVPGEADQ
jgi:hypothetical protein